MLATALVVSSGSDAARAGGATATAAAEVADAAPTPTPARLGKPSSIALIGDSISQSTGTGPIAQENPENSWGTGWQVNSVAARLGIPTNQRFNYSANGDKMTDFAPQVRNGKSGGSGDVAPMGSNIGLVLVELGGNDLCKDSVEAMTSVETYRSQFKAGLEAVAERAPNALIQVMSVPDIYNLWYIRGAPYHPTYHPEAESSQAGGINGARYYWDGLTELGVEFPCQSLLARPTSWEPADVARRAAVRERNKQYNQVLFDECTKVLRCKFDNKQLFNMTSNRANPPDGSLLPEASRNLVDGDISRNSASLCPLSGLLSDGCGDHFHPSKQGQEKIALLSYTYGRNFADETLPFVSATVLPSGRPDGKHYGRAVVDFLGADTNGLRGQEVRVHRPNGTVTPWVGHNAMAPDLVVDEVGTSYVEVRSLDQNGNLSASVIVEVNVLAPLAPGAPSAPTVTGSASGLKATWAAPADDGGGTIRSYQLSAETVAPVSPVGTPASTSATTATPPTTPNGTIVRYRVRATNDGGQGPLSSPGPAVLAPFPSLGAFVDQQYEDFAGRAPTPAERAADVAALEAGTLTPVGLVDRLRSATWFDGAYGPATRLYRAYFLRLPDPSGLDYWANKRRNGTTLSTISQQFSVSSEFVRRYGSLSNAAFIDTIYDNVFDRAPDPSGRSYYLRKLSQGWTRGQVVLQFSESSEYKRKSGPVVDIVELHRGMHSKAPSQAEVDARLVDHGTGGTEAVFEHLLGLGGYRTRVFA